MIKILFSNFYNMTTSVPISSAKGQLLVSHCLTFSMPTSPEQSEYLERYLLLLYSFIAQSPYPVKLYIG